MSKHGIRSIELKTRVLFDFSWHFHTKNNRRVPLIYINSNSIGRYIIRKIHIITYLYRNIFYDYIGYYIIIPKRHTRHKWITECIAHYHMKLEPNYDVFGFTWSTIGAYKYAYMQVIITIPTYATYIWVVDWLNLWLICIVYSIYQKCIISCSLKVKLISSSTTYWKVVDLNPKVPYVHNA